MDKLIRGVPDSPKEDIQAKLAHRLLNRLIPAPDPVLNRAKDALLIAPLIKITKDLQQDCQQDPLQHLGLPLQRVLLLRAKRPHLLRGGEGPGGGINR